MNHGIKHRKLGRSKDHKKALLSNLSKSLLQHEQIITTTPKAKELRVVVDKLITLGKKDTLSTRRAAYSKLQNAELVNKLFGDLKERYASRNGGYTRVLKAGFRKGDNAELSVIELVDRNIAAKGKKDLEFLAQVRAADQAE